MDKVGDIFFTNIEILYISNAIQKILPPKQNDINTFKPACSSDNYTYTL